MTMRKQELIHLHALATELYRHIDDAERPPPTEIRTYERNGVTPVSIHHNKESHKAALHQLLEAVITIVDEQQSQSAETLSVSP